MEIQRYGCDRLEVTIDGSSPSTRDRELEALESVLLTWIEKCETADACTVFVTDSAEALKVADRVDFLNRAQSSVKVLFDSTTPVPFPDETMDEKKVAERKSHLCDLIMLAVVDGQFQKDEQKMIVEIGKKMGFSDRHVNSIYNEMVLNPEASESAIPEDASERLLYLAHLCQVILADGKIDDWEAVLIFPMAVKMGFDSSDVAAMLEYLIVDEEL